LPYHNQNAPPVKSPTRFDRWAGLYYTFLNRYKALPFKGCSMFGSLSIKYKILFIPLVGSLSFLIYLFIAASGSRDTADILKDTESRGLPIMKVAEKNLVSLDRIKEGLSNAVAAGDEDMLASVQTVYNGMQQDMQLIEKKDSSMKALVTDMRDALADYYTVSYDISKGMIDGTFDMGKLSEASGNMVKKLQAAEKLLKQFQEDQNDSFTNTISAANNSTENLIKIGILMGVITVVVLFAAAFPVLTGIRNNLGQVVGSLRKFAKEDGDLTARLKSNSKDEIGDLVHWFNTFIEKLQGTIKQVVDVSKPMSDLADNVSHLGVSTRKSIDFQDQSVHNARKAVDQMNQSVRMVAENAENAANAAQEAFDEANSGQKVVQETVRNMQSLAQKIDEVAKVIRKLEEDSNQVSTVVDVIRSIAEQTNLLALNAAIEAARAGEQGRGFAVVADEVRTLASRTQQSTKEIDVTIQSLQEAARRASSVMADAITQTQASVNVANKAGDSLQSINTSVEGISQMNIQIASSTEEQLKVADAIVRDVEDIQRHTQESLEGSHTLERVSNELAELAKTLRSVSSQFRV
jgi:methyl-accepting chemotaxis protein